MEKLFGIDVSRWQKGLSLKRAKKEGARFVVARGAWHLTKDTAFSDFYEAAHLEGLYFGVYLYTMARSEKEARDEAAFLINNCLRGRVFELPIFIDIENAVQQALDRATNTAIVRAFCEELAKNGYLPGVYASKSFFETHLNDSDLKNYPHWVAQWNSKCTFAGPIDFWQFGGETNFLRSNRIAGQVCDQDEFYRDYPAYVKSNGLNGYRKAEPKNNDAKTVNTKKEESRKEANDVLHTKVVLLWQQAAIADGYLFPRFGADGIWGEECETVSRIALVSTSASRKNAHLTRLVQQILGIADDSICGPVTEKAIKKYQTNHGLTPDGIVGEKTWKKLLQQ